MDELMKIHPLGVRKTLTVDAKNPDVTLSICDIPALVNVFAKRGQETAVMKKLGFETIPSQVANTSAFKALPISPGQWILISKKDAGSLFAGKISKEIKSVGYVSEQSESRICIRISGPKARELMSRGCQLDLHPSIVSKGYCAQTTMAQVGVLLHVVDDEPIYDLYVYSGFARSFWHWLTETAQQFDVVNGVSVDPIAKEL